MKKLSTTQFRHDGTKSFVIADAPTRIEPLYADEADRAQQLNALTDRMD